MKDEDLVRSYIKNKSTKLTALELNVPRPKVTNRLMRLRKYGVNLPKYGYTSITPEQITGLNDLVRSLN